MEKSTAHAYEAIAAGPTDPRGHEALSVALMYSGQSQAAWAAMEDAERFGSKDFGLYTRMAEAEHTVRKGEMSGTDARRVLDRYRKAIAINPGYRGGYNNFAAVVGRLDFVRDEDKQVLEEGARRFPDDPMISIGLAQILHRQGNEADAKARIDAIVAATADDPGSGAKYARQIQATWAQDEVMIRVNQHLGQRDYDAAQEAMNGLLASTSDPEARSAFEKMAEELKNTIRGRRLDDAVRNNRWEEARQRATEAVDSDAPAALKTRARQLLNQLDQRKLGLPKTNE